MAELKTKATNQDPGGFLGGVEPEQKRTDSFALLEMFQKVTGEKAVMWGLESIITNQKEARKKETGC